MRSPRVTAACAVLASALWAVGCADAGPSDPAGQPAPEKALQSAPMEQLATHMIVLNGENAPSDEFLGLLAEFNAEILTFHPEIGVLTVGGLTDEQVAEIRNDDDIDAITPDLAVQWQPNPDDLGLTVEDVSSETDQSGALNFVQWQWNMRQIDADDAWLVTPQGVGTKVAILDSGIDPFHMDTDGKVDLANSFTTLTPGSSPCNEFLGLPDEETIFDFRFHGTFVAAIVTSNGWATASVAPDALIVAGKVLNCNGVGSFGDVIDGIIRATDVRVDVINMSLGATLPKDDPSILPLIDATQRAVDFARKRGVLVVASSGNGALNLDVEPFLHIPSQLNGVLSVGATGPINQQNFDMLASYSNFGVSGNTVTAPGGNFDTGQLFEDGIRSPCSQFSVFFGCSSSPTFYIFAANGTSFAAPHAAGAGAVIESTIPGNQHGAHLFECIVKGADNIDGSNPSVFYGRGRINVLNSVMLPECGGVGATE